VMATTSALSFGAVTESIPRRTRRADARASRTDCARRRQVRRDAPP
jgi:hypothetical protein